jgi:hypothetical protein
MNMNTAEKIETIVDCFLRSGTTEGTLGTLHVIEPGWFRVVADGLTVIVRTPFRGGWQVTFKGFAGIDSELYVAAHNALESGKGCNVSTMAEALS